MCNKDVYCIIIYGLRYVMLTFFFKVRERLEKLNCNLDAFLRDVSFLDTEVQRYEELVSRAGSKWGGEEHTVAKVRILLLYK